MVDRWQTPTHEATASFLLSTLTGREREIAAYITCGTPNKIIAAELGISQRTIEAHRARIFVKMRVRNAVQLTQRCLDRPPIVFNGPDRPGPDATPAHRWDRCPPGASALIPAVVPVRSGGSPSVRSTG